MQRAAPAVLVVALVAVIGCSRRAPPTLQAADAVTLYPTPRYVAQEPRGLAVATACVDTGALPAHDVVDALAPSLLAAAGLRAPRAGERCQLRMAFSLEPPPDLDVAAAAAFRAASGERYVVLSRLDRGGVLARLWAGSERAALHALVAALALVDGGVVRTGVIVDGPAIAQRGLVEGHYGTPLSAPQRRCLLEAMLPLHQNLYLYGPKDDPFAHDRWAEPYPPEPAAALGDAVDAARARAIDFVWAVSPGLLAGAPAPGASISFASDDDFARLTAKLDAMRALGVRRFALFLDDIAHDLVWSADRAAFASPVAAHAALANRLDAWVSAGGGAHLLFVAPVYTSGADGWRSYVAELGARLAPGIDVLWTGPRVYSPSIAAADLRDVDAALARPVVIWDNEPEDPSPLSGRATDLPQAIGGYLTNTVMLQQGYAFADLWQALGPVADYAWNPSAYDATASQSVWSARAGRCLGAAAP